MFYPSRRYKTATGAMEERCPDGRVNAWEAVVPNGVYMVTVSAAGGGAQFSEPGCTFENVVGRGTGGTKATWTYSVEVSCLAANRSAATPFLYTTLTRHVHRG